MNITRLVFVAVLQSMVLFLEGGQSNLNKNKHPEKSIHVEFKDLLPVIEGQLKELRAGNVEKAYLNYTSKLFQENTSLEEFKKLVDKFKVLSDNKIFQYQSFYVENGIATFEGSLISNSGKSVSTEYDLSEEDGAWKIMGLQLYKHEVTNQPR